MGIIDNIKENIKDIFGGGIGNRFDRKKKENEALFDKLKKNPRKGRDTGFTPVKDPSGMVSDARRSSSGGGGGGGGGRGGGGRGSSGQSAAQIKADKIRDEIRNRASRQLEINRQARIRAGTIGGQQSEVLRQAESIALARGSAGRIMDLRQPGVTFIYNGTSPNDVIGGGVGLSDTLGSTEDQDMLGLGGALEVIPTSNGDQLGGEAGVFSITEDERKSVSPSRPFVVVPSDFSPAQAIGLGGAVSQVVLTPDLPGKISGEAAFKKDRKAILEATTNLTDVEIKTQIKKDVQDRPVGEQIFSRSQDVALGGSQLIFGAGEFAVDAFTLLGQQELGKKRDRFRFGGIVGDIQEQPTGFGGVLGKVAIATPLVVGGITQFAGAVSSQGLRVAGGELITSFAPFRIPTQTFGALAGGGAVRNLKFDVKSLKFKQHGATKRVVTGKALDFDNVFLISKQSSKGGVGGATTDITAPQTRFQLGGFTEGFTSVRTESIIAEIGGAGKVSRTTAQDGLSAKQIIEGVTGGGSRVSTRQVARITFDKKGVLEGFVGRGLEFGTPRTIGGISKQGEFFDEFGSGAGRRILELGKGGTRTKVRVDEFNIRGKEFDLAKLYSKDQFGVSGIPAGGKSVKGFSTKDTGLENVAKQISASVSDLIPSVSAASGKQTSRIITVQEGIFGSVSRFTGTGQFELTSGGQSLVRPETTKDFLKVRDVSVVDLAVDLGVNVLSDIDIKQKIKPVSRGRDRVTQRPGLDFRPDVALDVGTDVITKTRTIQEPKTITKTRQPRPFSDPFFDIFSAGVPSVPTGFILPPVVFGTFPSGRRKVKGRRPKERIAPSLTGLIAFDFGGITGGPLKLSGKGGRSPFDIRFVPEDLAGKRSPGLGLGIFPSQSNKRTKKKK